MRPQSGNNEISSHIFSKYFCLYFLYNVYYLFVARHWRLTNAILYSVEIQKLSVLWLQAHKLYHCFAIRSADFDRLRLLPQCAQPHFSRNIGEHETKQSSHLAGYAGGAKVVCAHPLLLFQVSATLPLWDHNFGLLYGGRFAHLAKRRFPAQRSRARLQSNLPS